MKALTRRESFQRGACALGGLSLPQLLSFRARAAEKEKRSIPDTAVIFVTMGGGPSQHETYDPKPDAGLDYRGPFGTVATNVPGVHFCDLFPKQAAIMDKLVIVRSITHKQASHIAEHIVETGYDLQNSANSLKGEMPSCGSYVSKIRGLSPVGIPAYVTLPDRRAYGGAHYLGGKHRYYPVNDDPNAANFTVKNLTLARNLDVARLEDRRTLLGDLDAERGALEEEASAKSIDAFTGQAFDLVTGERAREAFDISKEPDALRDLYGRNATGQRMLLARRLVESGVPFVTVRTNAWDDHRDLAKRMQDKAAVFDPGMAALITDLHERGLKRDVLVVAMGEFGRTPKVNGTAGRDHWPALMSVLISGGKYQMGQVIGESDKDGAYPRHDPYPPQSVLAMMYRHLGIDPGMTFEDFSGRPRYILEERRPVRELI